MLKLEHFLGNPSDYDAAIFLNVTLSQHIPQELQREFEQYDELVYSIFREIDLSKPRPSYLERREKNLVSTLPGHLGPSREVIDLLDSMGESFLVDETFYDGCQIRVSSEFLTSAKLLWNLNPKSYNLKKVKSS